LPADLVVPAGYSIIDELDLTLGSGDGIYAEANPPNVVDSIVSGLERDV